MRTPPHPPPHLTALWPHRWLNWLECYHQSRGILQQYVIPGHCRAPPPSTVGAERRGAPGCQVGQHHVDSPWLVALATAWSRQQIDFKICLLVYKCLHQRAAPYLKSMVTAASAVSTRRHLRSAGQGDLVVPRTRTVGFGPWSFSVAGPSLWNALPSDMKLSTLTAALFRSLLKTVMFVRSFYAWAQPSQFRLLDLGEI